MMSINFDQFVENYETKAVIPIPEEIVSGLCEQLNFSRDANIIDLGCGNGRLTWEISKFFDSVTGLDCSRKMIESAKSLDSKGRIRWILADLQTYDLGVDQFDVVVSFESFHLFPRSSEFLNKIVSSIKPGGVLAVGWLFHHWEEILRDLIVTAFSDFGHDWGDWGYQSCDFLDELVLRHCPEMSKSSAFRSKAKSCSVAPAIGKYLSGCIQSAAGIDLEKRRDLCSRLVEDIDVNFGNEICGDDLFEFKILRKSVA